MGDSRLEMKESCICRCAHCATHSGVLNHSFYFVNMYPNFIDLSNVKAKKLVCYRVYLTELLSVMYR